MPQVAQFGFSAVVLKPDSALMATRGGGTPGGYANQMMVPTNSIAGFPIRAEVRRLILDII